MLSEATEFISNMSVEPNAKIQGALLNGVSVSGDVELGKFVSDHLFEMEPENTGNSVIMANLYSRPDYGRIVEILHSRWLRFDKKNWRASYNSLNLLRAPDDSWTRECCKRVSEREKCKGENVEDIHVIITRVQVTDESVEYLKSGSAVFSVLRNLGKSEERVCCQGYL